MNSMIEDRDLQITLITENDYGFRSKSHSGKNILDYVKSYDLVIILGFRLLFLLIYVIFLILKTM